MLQLNLYINMQQFPYVCFIRSTSLTTITSTYSVGIINERIIFIISCTQLNIRLATILFMSIASTLKNLRNIYRRKNQTTITFSLNCIDEFKTSEKLIYIIYSFNPKIYLDGQKYNIAA